MAKHFQDITRKDSSVHLLMPDQNLSLCAQIKTHEDREGYIVQRLWEVDKPVNCKRCIDLLIGVVRAQLRHLTSTQLESLLDVIVKNRKANNGTRQNQ